MIDAYSEAIADALVDARADGTVRLSTLLAATGLFTRRQVKRGQVEVDGALHKSDHPLDVREPHVLRYRGWRFEVTPYVPLVLAVDKPAGVVCSHRSDGLDETIYEWLGPIAGDVEPVGRLDKETTGLLLLTDDGQLSQRLRHPSRGFERVYLAQCSRPIPEDALQEALREGVSLRDGTRCHPASLEPLVDEAPEGDAPFCYRVVLREGRYHEVRRLVAALGSHVEELRRVQWGPVTLVDEAPEHSETAPSSINVTGPVDQLQGALLRALYDAAALEMPTSRVRISSREEDEGM